MLIVNRLIARARGLARVLSERAATVELDWDKRARSRFDAVSLANNHSGVNVCTGVNKQNPSLFRI